MLIYLGQLGFGRASAGYSFNRFHRFRFTAWTQQWIFGTGLSEAKHIPLTPKWFDYLAKRKGKAMQSFF
jgi:hypothetical protein